jgi:predicted O-methyltransferase YrrM
LDTKTQNGRRFKPNNRELPMRSSYAENDYKSIFQKILNKELPKTIVECGLLDGYSFFTLADFAKKYNGIVFGVDLFDDYQFNHPDYSAMLSICEEKYLDTAFLIKGDALLTASKFRDGYIDLLHLDISNTGDRLSKLFEKWYRKVRVGGTIIFEGGSRERDNIEWMKKCKERTIRDFIKEDLALKYDVDYYIVEPFPSITVCKRR